MTLEQQYPHDWQGMHGDGRLLYIGTLGPADRGAQIEGLEGVDRKKSQSPELPQRPKALETGTPP